VQDTCCRGTEDLGKVDKGTAECSRQQTWSLSQPIRDGRAPHFNAEYFLCSEMARLVARPALNVLMMMK